MSIIDYTDIRDDEIRSHICKLMSEMLDNPDKHGIYPTARFMWKMENYCLGFKAELEEIKRELAEDYAYQYKCLVECDEKQLSPDAIRVRQILLKDKAENKHLKKALRWIAGQFCKMEAEGSNESTDCVETDACVTEFCLPCYARVALSGDPAD